MKTRDFYVPLLLVFSMLSGCCCYDVCSTYTCCPDTEGFSEIPEAPPAPIIDQDEAVMENGGFIETF